MLLLKNTIPVELTCKHILCIKCVVTSMIDQEICCNQCDTNQRILHETHIHLVQMFKLEQTKFLPELKYKTHSKESLIFCKKD